MALAKRAVGQMKKTLRTKYARIAIDFSIITLVGVVIFRNFIFTNEWPGGGDVLGWISRAYLWKDFRWFYVWRQYSFGFVEGMAIRVMDLSFLSIYYACGDPAITVKIFLFLSFLIAGFSIYAFAYRFTHQHIASLSASMTYTLNSWFFSQFTEAHADIVFSYALAPLIFLLVDRAFDRRKPKDVLALAIGLSVSLTSFHLESTVIYWAFLILYVILYILSAHIEGDDFHLRFRHFLKLFLPAFLIAISLSAFYYVQFAITVPYVSPTYGYPIEWAAMDSYKNMTDPFILKASEQWGYLFKVDLATGLSLPDFPISAFLLFLFSLAYAIVFVFRRDRYTVFFGLATLISVFVSKGPNPPFGYIFTWAWFNIPYFSVFRAASRSIMMAALSHSFFVGILVSILTRYVQKIRGFQIKEHFLNVKVKNAGSQVRQVLVSTDTLDNIVRGLIKFLHYSILAIIFFTFLSGFLASWFFFDQGLQVYSAPNGYLQPYEWIAEKPGDYKVVTVGQGLDFAVSSMKTDLGFGHDIGYESSFIHDKPTLQDGGYEPTARAFVDHLRFYLAPQQVTNAVGKILGSFNYRYIVIPPYANVQVRDFFLHQQGTNIVYNQSSLILENEYDSPHIFATPRNLFVIGGLETFYSLSTIDTFSLNENALIFADPKAEPLSRFQDLFNSYKALILVDNDQLDLVFLSLKKRVAWIDAAGYGVRSQDPKYWIQSTDWKNMGKLVLGGYTLQTSGKSSVNIPFRVDSSGLNDVWIRLGFGPSRGVLSVFIDNSFAGEIRPGTNIWANLMWVKFRSFNLANGDHIIRLVNDGTGFNDVDVIAILPPSLLESEAGNIVNRLQTFPGRLIYVLQAESAFSYDPNSDWSSPLIPYQGFMLHTEGIPPIVSPVGKASSTQTIGFEARNAIDGNIRTRWASSSGMPQWLQIDWDSPQELKGVQIIFEAAYAEDYVIQTWNGTKWVDQVSVKGNTKLDRYHKFPHPVQTTRVRVYVTYAPAFNMVSIWELRSYTTNQVSAWTKISIPRQGYYMLAARLASGRDYGTLDIRMNNFTTTILCTNTNLTIDWHESGPVFLGAGEQEIFIAANGKIDLDEIIVYSLKGREEGLSLDNLFKPEHAPRISIEQTTQINPSKYTASIRVENASEPFLLVFSETYHPMWTAYVDGKEISPIPVYSMVNGFLINKTGEFTVTLYFKGQMYAEIGLSISIITMIAVAIYFTLKSNLLRSLLQKSK